MTKQVKILGVRVDSSPKDRLLEIIERKICDGHKFYIVTPNPELILASTKNNTLKDALNSADFAIPDGVGLKIAEPSLKIIKGRELFVDLVKLAKRKRWRVFFLGGLGREAELAAEKLGAAFARSPVLNNKAEPVTEIDRKIGIDAVEKINNFKPHLLFIAFGNPKQEIWMYKRFKILDVRCMMGVGGTFRYIAGFSKLPPKSMEKLGLEWLWRLATEPFRFTRIWNAAVLFPLKVWQSKLSQTRV